MNDKEALLHKLQAFVFAEKEWNLYLDTHPTDKEGIMMHKKMAEKAKEIAKEFEAKYGPLSSMNSTNEECFEWINCPWPWE